LIKLQSLIYQIDELKEMVSEKQFHKMFFDSMQAYIMHLELEVAKIQVSNSESEED